MEAAKEGAAMYTHTDRKDLGGLIIEASITTTLEARSFS
jgi:hypothetical protein